MTKERKEAIDSFIKMINKKIKKNLHSKHHNCLLTELKQELIKMEEKLNKQNYKGD